MPTNARTLDVQGTPASQLQFFMGMLEPAQQKLFRAVRTAMRKRMPTANELVYDYLTFFVITYSATEHPTDGIITIAGRPEGVRLYVMLGKNPKADPKKLLKGSGTQARYVEIASGEDLSNPDIETLIRAAIAEAKTPLPDEGSGKLVIRSISPKRGLGKVRSR
ncbi:MAG: hypothetical protein ACO1Q7_06885 [Gemmatimonas sp.]